MRGVVIKTLPKDGWKGQRDPLRVRRVSSTGKKGLKGRSVITSATNIIKV